MRCHLLSQPVAGLKRIKPLGLKVNVMFGHHLSQAATITKMAGVAGLEPVTSAVTGQRSNQLSYTPVKGVITIKKLHHDVKVWF